MSRLPKCISALDWPDDATNLVMTGWDSYLSSLDDIHDRTTLVHTDVWPQNLIYDSTVWRIVDFDDLAVGPPELDIASTLAEIAIDASGAIVESVFNAVIRGFRETNSAEFEALEGKRLVASAQGLYASWMACDACHRLPFSNVEPYYSRLKSLESSTALHTSQRIIDASISIVRRT